MSTVFAYIGIASDVSLLCYTAGVEADRFFITTDFVSELFRAASAAGGSIPSNNWLLDRLKSAIALIGLTVWRLSEERVTILAHREEHRKEVVDKM